MKKKVRNLGIIALVAVIGFTMFACGGGGGNGGPPATSYTLTFNGNGHTGGTAPEKITKNKGTATTVPDNGTLVKTGSNFTGWNTAANGSGDSYAEGDVYNKNTSATLYAQWTAEGSYTLTFNGNGNTGGTAPASITENIGTAITIPGAGDLVRTGYSFTGWNTKADSSGDDYEESDDYEEDKNATLYAQWTVVSQTPNAGDEMESNVVGIKHVWVPAGTFIMGSPASETDMLGNSWYDNERSQRQVTVSGFWMGKYQVAQAEWKAVMGMGYNPSYFTGDNLPVDSVSWYEVIVFCNRLSIKEGLTPAYQVTGVTNWETQTAPTSSNATWNAATINPDSDGYRLPTEAQWEYACRAGTTTAFYNGDNTENDYHNALVGEVAWFSLNNSNETKPVGQKTANAWGLHDMHGNVFEWCWDWYTASYNDAGGSNNPQGATSGTSRVLRGGTWLSNGQHLRSAYRNYTDPWSWYNFNGFRLVRPL
jgi:uncharacterized repeat protein (TIGR02543 family)